MKSTLILISLLSSSHGLQLEDNHEPKMFRELDASQKYWGEKQKTTRNKELEDARILGVAVSKLYARKWEAIEKLGFTTVQKFTVPNLMNVGLFKDQHDSCVLAMTGLENYQQSTEIAQAFQAMGTTENVCGNQIHAWTAKKFKQMMTNEKMSRINDYLGSKQCSNITVAGHSVGGAIAPVYASCVDKSQLNFKQGQKKNAGKPSNFKVDRIFTYGAWAISKHAVANEGGCFNGIRFFRQAGKETDYFATVGQKYGFVHPKMRAVALLTTPGKEDITTTKEYDCDHEKTPTEPSTNSAKPNLIEFVKAAKNPGALEWLHNVEGYTAQLKNLL